MKSLIILQVTLLIVSGSFAAYKPQANSRVVSHYEPQIACPPPNQNQPPTEKSQYTTPSYLTPTSGSWTPTITQLPCPTINSSKKKRLNTLLRICQKTYTNIDVVNIVESSHVTKVLFCNRNGSSCAHRWVTPWRCLESPFQSEALLVPSPCLFDHIHNSSKCTDSSAWNTTALQACARKGTTLKSYAVLLPCGVGMFTGVEFVCCPKEASPATKDVKKDDYYDDDDEDGGDGDEDDDDDDEDDYDEDEEYGSADGKTTSTTTTTAPPPTVDPYFRRYDTINEHENFLDAGERLEQVHKSRINHVMEDWGKLEARYQKIRETDPKGAEEFKKSVTVRFQKTVQSLEEESLAEKKQLIAVHQQRVMSHLNERKKEAMECFTRALNERPQILHRIRKCMERLMRSLHKERHHTLSHVNSENKEKTIEKLGQISNTARESLKMIERYPKINTELKPLIEDYVLGLQGRDDPVHNLLTSTREEDVVLVDKLVGVTEITSTTTEKIMTTSATTERTTQEPDYQNIEPKSQIREQKPDLFSVDKPEKDIDLQKLDSQDRPAPVAHLYEENEIGYSHVGIDEHSVGEVSVKKEFFHKENKSVYVTMAFGGVALLGAMVIGLVLLRRRTPRGQGFSEVATHPAAAAALQPQITTPEEKHVVNMQINGYENPTYRFFESK